MVTLSIDRINKAAPYNVEAMEKDGFYQFVTDYGVRYSIGFDLTEGLLSHEVYQFIITNVNNRKSLRDHKLRDTIMAIIYEFFEANNTVMLYICETGDNKQSMRSRLFEYWWATSPRKSDFTMVSANIRDAEGVRNYASIILRLDNPDAKDIVAEFTETVQLLSQKP